MLRTKPDNSVFVINKPLRLHSNDGKESSFKIKSCSIAVMRLPDGRCHRGDNLLEERGEKTTSAQLVADIPRYFLAA
jgi:hypothetical protein